MFGHPPGYSAIANMTSPTQRYNQTHQIPLRQKAFKKNKKQTKNKTAHEYGKHVYTLSCNLTVATVAKADVKHCPWRQMFFHGQFPVAIVLLAQPVCHKTGKLWRVKLKRPMPFHQESRLFCLWCKSVEVLQCIMQMSPISPYRHAILTGHVSF